MAVIFITHDLGVVAEVADDVLIMYAGQVVEQGSVYQIFGHPRHPYTNGLLKSVPTLDTKKGSKLPSIKGSVPSLFNRLSGCPFHNRCESKTECCTKHQPSLEIDSQQHGVACHHYKDS